MHAFRLQAMLDLLDEKLDDVVPLPVLRVFFANFAHGFEALLKNLGFDKGAQ